MSESNSVATRPPQAARPAHVPESLVYAFDLFNDPALLADPHARIADLLEKAPPVFWTPYGGGHWMVTSYEGVFEAARDPESFSNDISPRELMEPVLASLPPGPRLPHMVPISLDPPEHGKYRMPLASAFSPKSAKALRGDIQAYCRELITRVAPDGRCEFMSAVAEPLPVHVFLKLMGLPLDRMRAYRNLVVELMRGATDPLDKVVDRLRRIVGGMRDIFLERKENPQDDLISRLWAIEIEGRPTSLEDLEDFGALLFIAGLDTVMLAMGFAARRLAIDPELQAKLRANPDLIPEASEEMLRRYTFIAPPRRVAKDVVFRDVEMKRGERLVLFLPGADLDPARFPDPEAYDIEREDKAHLVFNAGPHRCMGSHLARLELQILYEELLAGLPPFRLDPERPPTFHGGHNLGLQHLHLVWDTPSMP